MMEERTWQEFKDSKLLWWVNRSLHLFGWAIVFEVDGNDHRNIRRVYPARVSYRGFAESSETEGFVGLTNYLLKNVNDLKEDVDGE